MYWFHFPNWFSYRKLCPLFLFKNPIKWLRWKIFESSKKHVLLDTPSKILVNWPVFWKGFHYASLHLAIAFQNHSQDTHLSQPTFVPTTYAPTWNSIVFIAFAPTQLQLVFSRCSCWYFNVQFILYIAEHCKIFLKHWRHL